MPVIRSEIETTIGKIPADYIQVPVSFTDELIATDIYDFSFSSPLGDYLPYLFVGWFLSSAYKGTWYFASARRHEEMKKAVEAYAGQSVIYVYGQLEFNDRKLKQGELIFDRLKLHGDLPNRESTILNLIHLIDAEHVANRISVDFVTRGVSLFYYKDIDKIQLKPRR